MGVWSEHEVKGRVGKGRARHHPIGVEEDACTCGLRQTHPADVLTIGHRLGLGEGDELLGDLALVLLDVLARLAVAIVIDRATSIVSVVLVLLGQDELVAETSEGEVRLVAGDVGAQRDLARQSVPSRLPRR